MGVGSLGDGLGLGGVLSILLVSVGDCLSAGGEAGDDNLQHIGGDGLEVYLGVEDVRSVLLLGLVAGLRAGGEDEGDDLRLLGVGEPLLLLCGGAVLVLGWGVLGGGDGDLGRLRLGSLGLLFLLWVV